MYECNQQLTEITTYVVQIFKSERSLIRTSYTTKSHFPTASGHLMEAHTVIPVSSVFDNTT